MKKLNYLFVLAAAIITFNTTIAQTPQLQLWSTPPKKISFTPTPVVGNLPTTATGYNGSPEAYASNSMHDKNGNLLFFVVDDKVYDAQGYLIDNLIYNGDILTAIQNGGVISREISIVPKPGNCNQYYIIGSFTTTNVWRPFYAMLDLSLTNIYNPSKYGRLTYFNSNTTVFDLSTISPQGSFGDPYNSVDESNRMGIAVTAYRNSTNNHFLYVRGFSRNIEKFIIAVTGISWSATISYDPNSTVFSAFLNGNNPNYTEMEVISDANKTNYQLGFVYSYNEIGVIKLDYTTGNFISVKNATIPIITCWFGQTNVFGRPATTGLEFSPNGNYLYYTYSIPTPCGTGSGKLGYVDLTQTSLTTVEMTNPGSITGLSFIEMGYDGKMYFNGGTVLKALSNPNSGPSGFSWSTNVTGLTGTQRLPDQLDGQIYYYPTPILTSTATYACNTTAETYTINNYVAGLTYVWTITGGTIAGGSSTSYTGTLQSLNINWSSAGGTVTVTQYGKCDAATFTVKPCCRYTVAGKTTIYLNDVTETSPKTYSGSTNIVVVNGTYNINTNAVTYTNCPTYFGTDAQVNVNSGGYLKLISGTVWQAGCGAMWNGITVYPGGNLLVDNATIQDAKLAIKSVNGAPFTTQNNSKLNKNYRNIYFDIYAGTHPGIVKKTTISCLNTSGVPANVLITPYAGQRTAYGIETNNVNQVNIGVDVSAQANTLNNMAVGIYNQNSGLRVYNSNFTNITSSPGIGRCIWSSSSISEKLLIVGGSANSFQKNTFTNSTYGIFVSGSHDVNIISNTFNNLSNIAMLFASVSGSDNTVLVSSNTIDDCLTGVSALYSEGSKTWDVSNNLINQAAPTANSKPNSTAISITNSVISALNTPTLRVFSNNIKRVTTGIAVTNFTLPNIRYNTITALTDIYGANINGILVTTSPTADIESNTIVGTTSASWYMTGVRVESSANVNMAYNKVENVGRGLFYSGTCTGIEMGKNHMKNNMDGIFFNYAYLGPLNTELNTNGRATENTWEGSFTSHVACYYTLGTNYTMNLYSKPCTQCTGGQSMNPSPFLKANGPGSPNSSDIGTYQATIPSSWLGWKMSNPKKDLYLGLVKDNVKLPVYDEAAKWMSKYSIYADLQNDTQLTNNDAELKSFSDSLAPLNIGKFYKLNKLLTTANYNTNNAEKSLAELMPENIVEQNLKIVYAITIATTQNSSLSKSDVKTLQTIAQQCPYEGGYGVYNARVLLANVDSKKYINNCEMGKTNKLGKSGLKLVQADSSAGANPVIVYPNPANDRLNVSAFLEEGQTGVLNIYDLTGKLALTNMLTGSYNTDISTTMLKDGLYLYKVSVNNSVIGTGKLSIIR